MTIHYGIPLRQSTKEEVRQSIRILVSLVSLVWQR